ncbi:aspartate carbamoyltransferase, regulatory subunit [Pyrolobus fumarii 1A]|uniref:Aspartate carbamoyltransferase regulatory chain n=1 Tax=Pyrolobus fumarii (strain DSM 11204 / 1A) TaxID=694429 RepID=G0EHM1_PYRF1|nr:aspartate carbamoyltransferase regulatory subunit [Pyrolobus fumarii]AEM39374.1 aspartate carbamoyltransferase, regulatory subunit [Pyrolobus fumarii 1A]
MKNSELLVRKIREGTVIDHIPAGRALAVLKILGITGREGYKVALVMNVESRKLGRKDIVKVEGRMLNPRETDIIALIAPTATINIVKDYVVVEKRRVELPEIVAGVLKCKNPTCISRKENEPIEPKFRVVSRSPVKLQCIYCGSMLSEEDILEQILEG